MLGRQAAFLLCQAASASRSSAAALALSLSVLKTIRARGRFRHRRARDLQPSRDRLDRHPLRPDATGGSQRSPPRTTLPTTPSTRMSRASAAGSRCERRRQIDPRWVGVPRAGMASTGEGLALVLSRHPATGRSSATSPIDGVSQWVDTKTPTTMIDGPSGRWSSRRQAGAGADN